MKDSIDHMDKTIKEKFEGHEVPVPSHLWNSIESNLTPVKGTTGGNFFFNNPFIVSIVVIGTVLIGSYIYNSTNDKTDNTTSILSITNSSDNKSNSDENPYAKSIADNHSSTKEKNQSTGSLSNSTSTIDSEEKDQTSSTSSNIQPEVAPNSILSKNKERNHTSTKAHTRTSNNNIQSISSTTKNTPPIEKNYSTSLQNKSRNASNKNSQQYTNNNNNKSVTANQSENTDHSNTYSNNDVVEKEINTPPHSASKISNTKLNSSESINSTSAISATTKNTTTQAPNTTASKNSGDITVHADSIQQSTSAFVQESESFNKTASSDPTTSADKNTSTNNTTTASSSNQDIQPTQVGSITGISNSTSNIAKPSETESVYNQNVYNNETTETRSASANNQGVYNTNTAKTSSTNTYLDSVNNSMLLENYSHTHSSIENDTLLTASHSTEALLLKTDSTTEHLDTISVEKQSKTIEVKSSEEAQKKKSLFLSRCSFDGYATPAISYLYLSPNSNLEGISEQTKQRNQSASPGSSLTTGLRMNYALTQKLEVGIGLQYSSLRQQSSFFQEHKDSTYAYQGYNVTDSTYDTISHHMIYHTRFVAVDSSVLHTLSSTVQKHIDKFQNFSIPIHIAYGYSISNKLSLLARTSVLINYQTYSITYFNASDNTIVGHQSNKNLSLGGSFSIGCYYLFSKRCSVFAEPIVTYYFSNVFDKQAPFKQKQLMLGLQTGVRLSF